MTNIELKNKLLDIVNNYNTIYGMGTWGWIVTQSAIDRKVKESSWWTSSKVNIVKKVIGKNYFMFDCVGLIKGILWGWNGSNKIYGGAGYACNGVPDVNTEGMLAKCKNVSTNFSNVEVEEYLWMSGHCAIYIGDGLCVECTPIWKNGVQITAVANIGKKSGYNSRTWTKHGKLPYITYEKEEVEEVKQYKIIVDKIPVYTNSSNAKNNKSSVGTWSKGTYYIFNEAYGMINITKTKGQAGAWINPADNVIKEVEPPKEEVEEKPIETPTEEVKPPVVEEIPKDDEENIEKEPIIEDKPDETINNTPNEETNEIGQDNEEIEQELEETAKENIFVKIIKIIIDFIIGIFKR